MLFSDKSTNFYPQKNLKLILAYVLQWYTLSRQTSTKDLKLTLDIRFINTLTTTLGLRSLVILFHTLLRNPFRTDLWLLVNWYIYKLPQTSRTALGLRFSDTARQISTKSFGLKFFGVSRAMLFWVSDGRGKFWQSCERVVLQERNVRPVALLRDLLIPLASI